MAGKVKTRTFDTQTLKSNISKVIKAIKNDSNKHQGNHNKYVIIDVCACGHGMHPFGAAALPTDYIDVTIKVGNERFDGWGKYDAIDLANAIRKEMNDGKHILEDGDVYLSCSMWDVAFTFPSKVIEMEKPCGEFVTLNRLLKRYTSKELAITDLYVVDLFGKRGEYGESGDKSYLCYNPTYCQKLVNTIRGKKNSKDTLTFKVATTDDIDTDYSIRYETECYGRRYKGLALTITTPGGKKKAV